MKRSSHSHLTTLLLLGSAAAALVSVPQCSLDSEPYDPVGFTDDATPGPVSPWTPDAGDADTRPSFVGGLRAVSVAAGREHTCAVDAEGALYCWGSNEWGQLGLPLEIAGISAPRRVGLDGAKVRAVAAGARHTCVVTELAKVMCFGANTRGQLGRPAAAVLGPGPIVEPSPLTGLDFLSVATGEAFTCATYLDPEVNDAGEVTGGVSRVACWGDNELGQLGLREPGFSHEAKVLRRNNVPVGAAALTLGARFGLASLRTASGDRVQTWGSAEGGALGYPTEGAGASAPASVWLDEQRALDAPWQVGAGDAHACAALMVPAPIEPEPDAGDAGELEPEPGDGEPEPDAAPDDDELEEDAGADADADADAGVDAGISASLVCWGSNQSGQLLRAGDGAEVAVVRELEPNATLALGASQTCVIEDGVLACAGANDHGQLGIGSVDERPHAQLRTVEELSTIVRSVSIGARHVCAVVAPLPNSPTVTYVACWGDNQHGQLGDLMPLGTGYSDGSTLRSRPVFVRSP